MLLFVVNIPGMIYTADLHIHSHYAKATSKYLTLEALYQWSRVKGIRVVGTGDFTHPGWLQELSVKLEPAGNGFFRMKQPPVQPVLPGMKVKETDVLFCLSAEICTDYYYGNKRRQNHHLVYAPDFDTVRRINERLSQYGDLSLDGRPAISLSCRDLLEIVLESSARAFLVPAHAWTPWFSTLGSKTGYDSVEACFRDLSGEVFALETGLSSDPAMNRICSRLDRFALMSNSDAHSPANLGREANRFDTEPGYDEMFNAVRTGNGFLGTYEFFPEEGKYFHDGHRDCHICLNPAATHLCNGICPVCEKPLTIGVLNRVEKLADRAAPVAFGETLYIIPLPEILSEIHGCSVKSKKIGEVFTRTISTFGNELDLLHKVPLEDITRRDPPLSEAIRRMRIGEVIRKPGYDGVYGRISLFEEEELLTLSPVSATGTPQLKLF